MGTLEKFNYIKGSPSEELFLKWQQFLKQNHFDLNSFEKIDFTAPSPVIFDSAGNKFSIDFNENKLNYHKKKTSIKSELLSRAMGAGRAGDRILDLSAGLAIDAIFLSQLDYKVTALERYPLIYLALNEAREKLAGLPDLKFIFSSALDYFASSKENYDVIYFDPMFPEKIKSALPRQEMVLFRNLVGDDRDATEVLAKALEYKNIQRIVVKRPMKAPTLGIKPHSQVEGKLVRFDLYNGVRK